MKNKLAEKHTKEGDESPGVLSADEMSVFYKQFLDNNYKKHMSYQR